MKRSQPPEPDGPADPIFPPLVALPRGPHGLTREQVVESQRDRLLSAIVHLVAEKGYPAATITETARRAGVSPNVFYEHFAGKEECFLAAYDVFAKELLRRVSNEITPTSDPAEFVGAIASAYLETLDSEREVARAFLLEMDAAGPEARRRRHEAFSAFGAVIKEQHERMRAADSSLGALPERTYLGIGIGVRALVCSALEGEDDVPLTELVPDVVHWITATFYGASAATQELGQERNRRSA